MGENTGISWTDATWNCVRGCSRVSEGCRNCYAERVAARFSDPGQAYEGLADRERPGSKWTGVVRMVPERLADPLRWKRPLRIFVNSMSDLFHEKLTNEEIAAVFGVMAAAPRHTFQVLTKRARRMREWFDWIGGRSTRDVMHEAVKGIMGYEHPQRPAINTQGWPLPNVWLGVSVEDQRVDHRISDLLHTPAAIRFLSCEPLIGSLVLGCAPCDSNRGYVDALTGRTEFPEVAARPHAKPPLPHIDWVIAGCESGPGARPCDVAWLRSLRDQCAVAGVPYFLKQAVEMSERVPTTADVDWFNACVLAGDGSKRKSGGVIELPYLDGVQHAAFPELPR